MLVEKLPGLKKMLTGDALEMTFWEETLVQFSTVQFCCLLSMQVCYRVEWAKFQERERKKEEEEKEKERVAYAQIDWHDFVVVETVDFQPNEQGKSEENTSSGSQEPRVILGDLLQVLPEASESLRRLYLVSVSSLLPGNFTDMTLPKLNAVQCVLNCTSPWRT